MSILDKAEKAHDQMAAKSGEFGGDKFLAGAIIRAVHKKERVNKILAEKGCAHRIGEFEIDDALNPAVVYYVTRKPE